MYRHEVITYNQAIVYISAIYVYEVLFEISAQ